VSVSSARPVPREKVPLRAVVTDVDGTLTDESRRLDPGAVAIIREIEDAGYPVVLATGNVVPIALALHRSLGLSGPVIAENGGMLYERGPDGRERLERLADPAIARRAYRRLLSEGLPVRRLFTDRWRESEVALYPDVSVRSIQRALHGLPLEVESTGYAIHLMERGRGKLPALQRALGSRGLVPADCVILGDGDNDVAMLRAAGYGVSFASGSARARRAARYVTSGSYAGGFVEGLKTSGILR
jgi:phosphoglycolate phosphatase